MDCESTRWPEPVARVVFHTPALSPVFTGHFPLSILKEWEEGRTVRFQDGVSVSPVKISKDTLGLRIRGLLLVVTAGAERFRDDGYAVRMAEAGDAQAN